MIDRVQEYEPNFVDHAEELKARAFEYAGAAQDRMAKGNEFLKSYVAQEPLKALGIALGLGVALGWLLKRR